PEEEIRVAALLPGWRQIGIGEVQRAQIKGIVRREPRREYGTQDAHDEHHGRDHRHRRMAEAPGEARVPRGAHSRADVKQCRERDVADGGRFVHGPDPDDVAPSASARSDCRTATRICAYTMAFHSSVST